MVIYNGVLFLARRRCEIVRCSTL